MKTKGGEVRALPAAKMSGRLVRLLSKVALMKMRSIVYSDSSNALRLVRGGLVPSLQSVLSE